jgi:membrane protease YdiL (CAAX protease family)
MTDSAPPPAPAPQPAATPAPAPGEKWNILSVIAFIIVFFGFSLISIILGFIGLNQIKKTGERGRGLALWAIILGFVSIVLGIIAWIVFFSVVAANPDVTVN